MNKRHIRLLCVLLAFVVVITTLSSCNAEKRDVVIEAMEVEAVPKVSFDFIGGEDVMPIAGYYTPFLSIHSVDGNAMPDYLTDEYFQMIADCGVNLITYPQVDYKSNQKVVMDSLDMAEKYGIAMCVMDANITGQKGATNEKLTVEMAVNELSNYVTHPAFAGLFLYDEPRTPYYLPSDGTHDLSVYTKLTEVLSQEIGIWCYQNLNNIKIDQKEAGERYLKEYCETQNPTYISFDLYPFDLKYRGKEDVYLFNLAIYREFAEKYNIPFWAYVAAGSQWNDEKNYFESEGYYPNEGEFDWSVNVNLVFGAKGIQYFPLFQPYWFAYATNGEYDFERNGLIGAWGNKNRWYYYAQDINEHIAVIDEVLMNAKSEGVLATGEKSIADTYDTRDALIEGKSWRELKDVSGDALVGCFNYQGKTALYVMNYSHEYAQKIDLTFFENYNVSVYQDAKINYINGSSLTIDMLPGEGVLLVFE